MPKSKESIYENQYDGTTDKFKSYKLHFHWDGSVLKLIWHKILLWLFAYTIIQIVYWFVLVQNEKGTDASNQNCRLLHKPY